MVNELILFFVIITFNIFYYLLGIGSGHLRVTLHSPIFPLNINKIKKRKFNKKLIIILNLITLLLCLILMLFDSITSTYFGIQYLILGILWFILIIYTGHVIRIIIIQKYI